MKIYEITLKPLSGFGTPLKGDTMFGHLCWQIFHDDSLCKISFDELIDSYASNPFAILSSAIPKFSREGSDHYAFKAPSLPPEMLFELPEDHCKRVTMRKELKGKQWLIVPSQSKITSFKELDIITDAELLDAIHPSADSSLPRKFRRSRSRQLVALFEQPHNTINRITGTTGEGRFAPFAEEQIVYYPATELSLFAGIDESRIGVESLLVGLARIGEYGYGKDATTGLGRYSIGDAVEIDLRAMGPASANACFTLSPCVPEKEFYTEIFFTPFTRYGKHGDVLAKSSNPFKNPVIMADEGAVLIPKNNDVFSKPYIGEAISNVSLAEPKTVAQGYSLYIPVRVEV